MITKLFVTRPTLAVVAVAVAVIGGLLAIFGLREQELPNVGVPIVDIIIFYPGATPIEMRDQIVRPIEDQLAGAPSLEHTQTNLQQGFASIVAQFSLKSSRTEDLVEVQRRMQAAQSQLPSDLVTPRIETIDPGESAVVSLAVTSKSLSTGALSALIQNQLIPALEQVPGVGYVQANGIVTPSVQVEVDPAKLRDRNLTINDVIGAIAVNNIRLPGGILYGANAETGINIRGDIHGPQSVAALQITPPALALGAATPAPVRVRDIAKVSDAYETERIYAYVNGQPNFFLTVQKSVGANEVDTAKGVIANLPQLQQRFRGIGFTVIDNQSTYTQSLLTGVFRTLLEGILLVGIVMIFFLRSWRNAAAVLIAIPTSLLATLMVMQLKQFTLDTVSLLAMTLITGILVDDSIVVLENSERHREMGESPFRAAINGRLEIGLAAIVITLVDVVVFLPIAFLPGIVGKFLSEFALVVVVATLASLFVSFTITPALAGNWSLLSSKRTIRLIEVFSAGFERLRIWYAERALPWGLRHPGTVVAIAAITLAGAVALVPLGVVGFEFDPAQDNGEIFVQISYPSGTPLTVTRGSVRTIEQQVHATVSDLRSETSLAGAALSPVGGYLIDGAVGQIDLRLKPNRKHSTDYWVSRVRALAERSAPTANPVVIPATNTHGGNSQPIDYLVSNSAGDATVYAQQVYKALAATPGAANVYSSASSLAPQLNISFNRDEARRRNISITTAANAIRAAFGGVRATQYETEDGLKDVQVIYPLAYQHTLQQIRNIRVRSDNGDIARIGDIAQLDFSRSSRSIDRVDRQTVIHVSANVASGASLSGVVKAFEHKLAGLHLPTNVQVTPNSSGTQQNLKDTINGMALALALGMLLVFLLMVALYNSYLSPFIIMFSVPVAVVGALGALALTRQSLNAFSLIGTVLLIGLVTKNGILLVDFSNQLRERGMEKLDAIRESARVRFRPIVMTTAAMVFGMLPLALGLDHAVESRRSLGIVVIGGLISSLLLTLILIPVIYVWLSPTHLRARRQPAPAQLHPVEKESIARKSGRAAL
ncbi:MAG TPA: efflux RND transporter permease subunit [Candidatus Eremiobacteraceae bacterium]|nr:efflux RND transporter permease subunit [Candidatus Eremiobacteraceae bacterium]